MKAIMSCVGGRAPPLQNMRSPVGLNRWRLHWLTLAQDLVRLAQLSVLAFQSLHALGHLAGNTRSLAAINLGLLDAVVQGLGPTADLRRDRHGRLAMRSVLPLIVEDQTHGTFAHFTENLFVVLLRSWNLRQIRRGSRS